MQITVFRRLEIIWKSNGCSIDTKVWLYDRGRGRPRKNWPETIHEDLRGLELTWEDDLDAAEDRDGWRTHEPPSFQTRLTLMGETVTLSSLTTASSTSHRDLLNQWLLNFLKLYTGIIFTFGFKDRQ